MRHLLRPYGKWMAFAAGGAWLSLGLVLAVPRAAHAQTAALIQFIDDSQPLLVHSSSQGYLGVSIIDVDAEKAQALKLKEVRGAVITLIDHDAPAGQIGLKINDVVLALDGQNVDGAEQLRKMLREIPPGHKISLEISRDGNIQTLAVQLVDRKALDHDIWGRIGNDVDGVTPGAPVPVMGITGSDAMPPSGFHLPLFTSSLNVGALVEPLTSQMAEYFGVEGGLMVKQVSKKSEAAVAGFKAFDVILKVGADSILTTADWDRALRSNQGKPVPVTILRNKKQQILNLQVDSKHRGAVELEDLFAGGDAAELADLAPALDADMMRAMTAQAEAEADALRKQMENLRLEMSQRQLEQLHQQSERLPESMKNFQIDPKQMQELQQQMEKFRRSFNEEQMQRLQQQMQRFRQQMEQWSEQNAGHFV